LILRILGHKWVLNMMMYKRFRAIKLWVPWWITYELVKLGSRGRGRWGCCFNWVLEVVHVVTKHRVLGLLTLWYCWETSRIRVIWIQHWPGIHLREHLLVGVLKRTRGCRWQSGRYRSYTRATMKIMPRISMKWVKHLLTAKWVQKRTIGYWGQHWFCPRTRKSHLPVTVHQMELHVSILRKTLTIN